MFIAIAVSLERNAVMQKPGGPKVFIASVGIIRKKCGDAKAHSDNTANRCNPRGAIN